MRYGRRLVVTTAAVVMLATLLGAPAQGDPAAVKLTLSYAQRCDDIGATMKPPTAHVVDSSAAPVIGEELTWTWREVLSASTYGEPHVYGTATTDATGTAALSVDAPVLDRPVLWNVKSTATQTHASGSAVAHQMPLSGSALAPRATIVHDGVTPKYYGRWAVKGGGVTQNAVGEGAMCPRVPQAGASVEVSYQLQGSDTWTFLGTTTVDAAGKWTMLFLPGKPGKYDVRARIFAYPGEQRYLSNSTRLTLGPGYSTLALTEPADSWLTFAGAGHRHTLSYTLGISEIAHGSWRPVAPTRSADLWFIDRNTRKRSLVHSFSKVPLVNGKAVLTHRTTVNRSGWYTLEYSGQPTELPAEAETTVVVKPTLRGWPKHGQRSTVRKKTIKTRTVTVGSLQSPKQRVLLLEDDGSYRDDVYSVIKTYKPNSRGKVKIRIPRRSRGVWNYKVFVGDVQRNSGHGEHEIYPSVGTFSGRWTITRK